MTNDEIREAVQKWNKSTELHNVNWIHTLGEFAEGYLKVKGWPEEKIIYDSYSWKAVFNETLRLCKLAAMKEKNKVSREIKNILSQPPDRISKITVEDYGQIRQKLLELINGKEA